MKDLGDELRRITAAYDRRIGGAVADRYSLFRPGELYMLHQREKATLAALRGAGIRELRGLRILEIGCGRGHRLADFQRWGADPAGVFGIDLHAELIMSARREYPQFGLAVASGHRIPCASGSFDILMQATVFTSILSAELKRALAAEMLRVLRPGGLILWYDFRYPSPRNPDVKAIRPAEVRALFAGAQVALRTVTLLPPLARALAPRADWLCRILETVPALRSHCLAVIRKR